MKFFILLPNVEVVVVPVALESMEVTNFTFCGCLMEENSVCKIGISCARTYIGHLIKKIEVQLLLYGDPNPVWHLI